MPVTDGYWNEGDPTLPTRCGDHLPLVLCFYVAIPLQYWLIGRLVRPVRDLHPGIRLPAVAGRHKLAPRVSPSKTVEGLPGGGLSATAIGACVWWITPFTFWGSAGMSLVIVLAGFLGGLALSAVKRSIGAKDWGSMIEGHGGILDRLDSVTFAAPIFFHVVHYAYM